jgi:hypothetical protein
LAADLAVVLTVCKQGHSSGAAVGVFGSAVGVAAAFNVIPAALCNIKNWSPTFTVPFVIEGVRVDIG